MPATLPHKPGHLTRPDYRADIDGLRAIAVLAVVGIHAFPAWVKGGFIGVDIFFVISGFLISTIIFENLERNSFSFIEFYSRRIKRIFPALLVVLIASFAFGWLVLFAKEYKQLGKHIAAGAGFVSNFVLWNESGYFDNRAETKPLLHLWSLGIEEQFYIVWPLMVWLAWKRRFNLLIITGIIAAVSFALNIWQIKSDAIAAFYSPQTRFWELSIGSTLAYLTLFKESTLQRLKVWNGNLQSFCGALLLTIGICFITKDRTFPGWWALLPAIGTALIISAGSQAWLNRMVFSNRLLVWFGLISFPLYLWHWPLLSFARITEGETPSREIRIAAIFFSIALAWLTYTLIEKPIRFGSYGKTKIITLTLLVTAVGYLGYNTYERDGLGFRFVAKNRSQELGNDGGAGENIVSECGIAEADKKLFSHCLQDSRQTPKYALVGDSKADAIYGGLFRTSDEKGRWLFIGGNGVNGPTVPVISSNELYKQYQKPISIAIGAISRNTDIEKVVLVTATRALFLLKNDSDMEDLPANTNYGAALEGLDNAISLLTEAGKQVVIVVDNPTLPYPQDCSDRVTRFNFINRVLNKKNPNPLCRLKISRHLELSKRYRDLLTQMESNHPESVKIFDTTNYLCGDEEGVCTTYKDGRPLYGYTDHISDYAAGLIGIHLNKFLRSD
jgi:peptidoglycan/LPS O-acetylase OafA/YrhL